MKHQLTILILIGVQGCGQQDLKTKITDLTKETEPTLNLKSKEDFAGGDVCGTIWDYSNLDSTCQKTVIKHEAGDYGQGENTYYIVDHRLALVKSLEIEWEYNEDTSKAQYIITETNYYFDNDRQGIKETKQIRLFQNDLDLGRKELEELKYSTQAATNDEYIKIKNKLQLDID